MANIILNGKTVVTQTGNDEPLIGGNVLMHSNAINTALSGATFPAGHVIQTVFNTHIAESIFSSSTPTSIANLTKAITLKTSNPYVLVILALNSVGKTTNNTSLGIKLTANDSGSLNAILSDLIGYTGDTASNFTSGYQSYLHNLTNDAAGTTITYTPQFWSTDNSSNAYINAKFVAGSRQSQIILMEIQK